MLTDQRFKKRDVMIGESMFYDPRYGVSAESAFHFREHLAHELFRFHYVYEDMNNAETEASKRARFDRLTSIGCPLFDTFIFPTVYPDPKLLITARAMNTVCCPFFYEKQRQKGNGSLLTIAVKWYQLEPSRISYSALADFLNTLE